jgi:hypothetical protein
VLEIQLRGLHFIDGTGVVPLADDALIPRPLRALQLTFRGVDRHLGKVGMLLAREDLPADLDLLTRELGIDAVERRLLALQLVGRWRPRALRAAATMGRRAAHAVHPEPRCRGSRCCPG